MGKKITIIDLAEKSGVSKSTISRYLQGILPSQEKIAKIEKAIEELNYVGNTFARHLRNQEPNLIGVLVPDLDNPFFLKIIKQLDYLAEKKGYSLIVKTTRSDLDTEKKALKFIQGYLINRIVICRSELEEEEVSLLTESMNIVSIDRPYQSIHSVVSDNFQNGYMMASHLASVVQGNLMFFAREKENISVLERIEGFKHRLRELNKPPFEYRYGSKYTVDLERLTDYMIENNIQGIISRNDNDALKIMTYINDLSNQGRMQRIRMAGFDNIDLSSRIVPRLTTVDQKINTMCEFAFDCLMENNDSIKHSVQEGELIIRESTI